MSIFGDFSSMITAEVVRDDRTSMASGALFGNHMLAGGMESMSQAPFCIRGRDGFTLAPGGKIEDSLMVALLDSYCGMQMASTAELYAEQQGITRQAQDDLALRSQQRADAAYKEGRIQEEQRRFLCGIPKAR